MFVALYASGKKLMNLVKHLRVWQKIKKCCKKWLYIFTY